MFSSDFFPTPNAVIEMMTTGIDLTSKKILEPSAGSGNIVDFLKTNGAEIIACENHPELNMIVGQKCQLIKPDFFDVTSQEISHINYIIMNPPFSCADRHIKHAWDIAPEGCEIIALSNSQTLENRYSSKREVLSQIIEKHGNWRNIGDVFSNAERKTDIYVALIHIFKPKTGENEFSDYFFDMNQEQEETVNCSGIVKHDEIREIVNRYVAAVKMFDSVMESNNAINKMISPINSGLNIVFGAHNTTDKYVDSISRDVFKKKLQKSSWLSIFNKMNMQKYVTKGVMSDINKFVEQQQQVPFTMGNIYKMIEIIIGTHKSRMDKVLVDTFDYICSLSADNSEAGEKWKTNSNYKINRRFIMDRITEIGWNGEMKVRYNSRENIDDIIKALCFITGKNYDDQIDIGTWFDYPYKINCDGHILSGYYNQCRGNIDHSFNNRIDDLRKAGHNVDMIKIDNYFGVWHDWGFFRVRGYKKGTMHFEFKDENTWMEFNRRVAKIKGWAIPQKTNNKTKGTEHIKQSGIEIYSATLF